MDFTCTLGVVFYNRVIDALCFHDLRHTAATRMGDAGADAFTLAAIFGWSDIRMAMRYTHAMEDASAEQLKQSQLEVKKCGRDARDSSFM